jgi:DNA-binding CsgD family transcriptional regulator
VTEGDDEGPRRPLVDLRRAANPDRLLEEAFARALRLGDARTGEQLAALMESRSGTAAVYAAMSRCLADLCRLGPDGPVAVLRERTASEVSLSVCERLRGRCPDPVREGRIVLTSPPDDRHTLALRAVGHQLERAGRPVRVLEDVPWPDVCEGLREEGTSALALSVHLPLRVAALRRLLAPVRAAAPQVLVVVGGPGGPHGAGAGAAVVTEDVDEVMTALADHDSALTAREREVLAAVADGMTTLEIADRLCLSSSTVKTHLDHILSKTGTEHRAAAVAAALRAGWLS